MRKDSRARWIGIARFLQVQVGRRCAVVTYSQLMTMMHLSILSETDSMHCVASSQGSVFGARFFPNIGSSLDAG